ncbi:hypothetical protein [Endozoicomonas sp. GU-1]|uniref:hypothetical protein n=1 Tax=Endozoicomonas sp. GU-1 TaxID=3009078 RepID=UPI0022B30237|nr:hypothetical protein [Endozoicomonas sp. GU-1]WBA81348.1 hypothetical protein O2T12_24215 [Endozoicomonas sp. GU-1]WBA84296.1 hypothetical protein O3276_13385 [Endozoicomonas sp. GU-1]
MSKVNYPAFKLPGNVIWLMGLLNILCIAPVISMANECFPEFDKAKSQYIVGYGSLLYEQARKSTNIGFKPEVPVWVDGFRRGWQTRTRQDNTIKVTELGVISLVGGRFNGVLISMPTNKIKSIDRQQQLTCRVLVNPGRLTSMSNVNIPENSQFWLYQTQNKYSNKPAGSYPILMSDVDEFLTGCLEQADRFGLESFARECVTTTWNWSSHWVNDRLHPLKAKPAQIQRLQVDKLLENLEGDLYEQVRSQ